MTFQNFCYYPTSPGALQVDAGPENRAYHKRNTFDQMVQKGLVHVHVRTDVPDVDLPWSLLQEKNLIVNFSARFEGWCPLWVGPEGLQQRHTFKGNPHLTFIPWGAIYGLQPKRSEIVIWEADVPPHLHKMFDVEFTPPNKRS